MSSGARAQLCLRIRLTLTQASGERTRHVFLNAFDSAFDLLAVDAESVALLRRADAASLYRQQKSSGGFGLVSQVPELS